MPFAWLFVAAIALAMVAGGTACGDEGDESSYSAKRAPIPSTGAPPWPAPGDPLRRTRQAGLRPERREQLAYHVHSHLDVFVNGEPITVPAGIGINTADPGVMSGLDKDGRRAYGGIERCAQPCISPLHTHDESGILHTESPTETPNRLGQFFLEWGVRLDRSCVGGFCRTRAPIAFFVNGERYTKDPRAIGLADHREIAIVIGSPPARIPVRGDFSEA
jgi:hypothetical protein